MLNVTEFCRWNLLRLVAIAGSVAVIFAASGTAALASTFTVTNVDDAGAGTLRDAIDQANGSTGADEIVFQAGLTGTIILVSELPTITDALSITGPGPRLISITGSNGRRIMSADAPLTISGIRLANGFTDRGAGIKFNSASGTLNVSDCHFDQNLATVDGGAICVLAGSASIQRTTFTTDQAAGEGGCIWYGEGGGSPTMTITNCTFVNNFASKNGGAIRQSNATAYASTITNCTFVVNNAGLSGGAIAVAGGAMTLQNSLFTANGAGGNPGGHVGTLAGTTTSLGHNLFGHLDGSNITPDPTDKFGSVSAQLNTGILIAFPFNNGGLTDTLPPNNSSSILIDGGGVTGAPTADQRGFPRVGCAPDVGAFEVQTVPDTDGDGVADACDICPGTTPGDPVSANGCTTLNPCSGSPDDDSDGVINCFDLCPLTPVCAPVDLSGCPTDSDGDGVFDGCDTCLDSLAGDPVDANGCSTADEDSDGILNDVDECPNTPAGTQVDAGGCGVVIAADDDGDGVEDELDDCPDTAEGAEVDTSGCAAAQLDTDDDSISDDVDECPNTPAGTQVGADGCVVVEVPSDDDGDGIADAEDNCPDIANADQADSDDNGVGDACDNIPDDGGAGQGIPEDDGQGQPHRNLCGAAGLITLWPMALGLTLMRRRRS